MLSSTNSELIQCTQLVRVLSTFWCITLLFYADTHRRISWGGRGLLGLLNFHQQLKELKSAGKIFIECPYDFASEVRYTLNLNRLKNVPPIILPQIRL